MRRREYAERDRKPVKRYIEAKAKEIYAEAKEAEAKEIYAEAKEAEAKQ